MSGPRICFGQQPCGFFPRRYLWAKILTARRLQAELGGEIIFFCHDSDHDARETQTILRHRRTGQPAAFNFAFANRIQRKWSPLYLKRVSPEWQARMARELPNYVEGRWLEAFRGAGAANAADFCLEVYRRLGLLEGITLVRSSDPAVRRAACPVEDFFVDLPHGGETVRARRSAGGFRLHEGGERYLDLPPAPFGPEQVSPTRDTRLRWMQSVVGCTHYVAGKGEQAYLHPAEAPGILFVPRDDIDRSDEAYTEDL